MSFSIELMQNMSDENVVNKTVISLSTVTGEFRDETSILNPVIKIEGSIPTTCNYFYIAEFNRYYYINDIKSIRNNLFEISGHVDVLKTYASQLRECSGIVARQQVKWNMYIDDSVFKLYQNPRFRTEVFSNGFSTMEFVFAVAGR